MHRNQSDFLRDVLTGGCLGVNLILTNLVGKVRQLNFLKRSLT